MPFWSPSQVDRALTSSSSFTYWHRASLNHIHQSRQWRKYEKVGGLYPGTIYKAYIAGKIFRVGWGTVVYFSTEATVWRQFFGEWSSRGDFPDTFYANLFWKLQMEISKKCPQSKPLLFSRQIYFRKTLEMNIFYANKSDKKFTNMERVGNLMKIVEWENAS